MPRPLLLPHCHPCVLLLVLRPRNRQIADFLVLDPTHFGVVFDPYATLVLVASETDLERVCVGGQLPVEHGTLLHQDLRHVEAEVNRCVVQEVTKPEVQEPK